MYCRAVLVVLSRECTHFVASTLQGIPELLVDLVRSSTTVLYSYYLLRAIFVKMVDQVRGVLTVLMFFNAHVSYIAGTAGA